MKPSLIVAIVVIVLIPIIALAVYKAKEQSTDSTASTGGTNSSASPSASVAPTSSTVNSPNDPADVATAHQVVLHTSKGDIKLNLFPDEAPRTVKNFVTLGAKRNYYNGTIFHRVIKDFVIQTGDPNGTGTGGESVYGRTFAGEIGSRKYGKGSLGMARTSVPDSYGSQFFITTGTVAQPSLDALDGQYTLFGQVADDASMQVVDSIAGVQTNPSNDKPLQDVKVTGMEIVQP